MIGTIVNTITIIIGTKVGVVLKKGIKEEYQRALFNAIGLAAIALGINTVVNHMSKSKYLILFIVSLALGGFIGYMINIDERFEKLTKKYSNLFTNDTLNLLISMVFVSTYGIGMIFAAPMILSLKR